MSALFGLFIFIEFLVDDTGEIFQLQKLFR